MRTHAPVAPALLLALAAACSDDTPMGAPNADSAPASLAIALATDSISPGKSVQLAATLTDADGRTSSCDECTWSSSDATVATVSSTGRLTWIKAGTAAITVTRGGTSATDTVTVFERESPPPSPRSRSPAVAPVLAMVSVSRSTRGKTFRPGSAVPRLGQSSPSGPARTICRPSQPRTA